MATKSKRQKTSDTGDLADSLKSNFLLKAVGGLANMDNYKGMAQRRSSSPAPKANPRMDKAGVAKSAAGLGYSVNKDGTFSKTAAKKPSPKKAALGGHGGY
jgi:hypothetical protein